MESGSSGRRDSYALSQLLGRIGELSRKAPLTVLCESGYRSSIAASLLESKGFERLTNLMGGMQAVRHESGRFRGVTPLSWPAVEDGNADTSAGRCSPTLRRAPEFVSAGEDVLHAGSIPSVVSSPSVCSQLD